MTIATAFLPHGQTDDAAKASDNKIRSIGKTRVQFDLTPRAMNLLTELKEKTDAASYAEVVKNALKLYDGLISEAAKGSEFLIRDRDGQVTPFRMFL